MTSIHLREVPAPVVAALKRRAKTHHRSLQGELHAILEAAAKSAPPSEGLGPLQLHLSKSTATRSWTREEIYNERAR